MLTSKKDAENLVKIMNRFSASPKTIEPKGKFREKFFFKKKQPNNICS